MSHRPAIQRIRTMAAVAAVTLIVAACGFTVFGGAPPIPVGPVGPVVPNPNGGPPVECRGIPIEQCLQSAGVEGRADVVRMIVTCTKVCTPTEGEFRLDLLTSDGRIEQAGGGAYMSGAAAPNPPEVAPPT